MKTSILFAVILILVLSAQSCKQCSESGRREIKKEQELKLKQTEEPKTFFIVEAEYGHRWDVDADKFSELEPGDSVVFLFQHPKSPKASFTYQVRVISRKVELNYPDFNTDTEYYNYHKGVIISKTTKSAK
jgi:hypothetical protein